MASNFEITVDKDSAGFAFKLAGDFDATSAYELIYAIKKIPQHNVKLSIYTTNLKSVHPFGIDVFSRFMSGYRQPSKIVFTGDNASLFPVPRQRIAAVVPEI